MDKDTFLGLFKEKDKESASTIWDACREDVQENFMPKLEGIVTKNKDMLVDFLTYRHAVNYCLHLENKKPL